jgi:hypothetical protein
MSNSIRKLRYLCGSATARVTVKALLQDATVARWLPQTKREYRRDRDLVQRRPLCLFGLLKDRPRRHYQFKFRQIAPLKSRTMRGCKGLLESGPGSDAKGRMSTDWSVALSEVADDSEIELLNVA